MAGERVRVDISGTSEEEKLSPYDVARGLVKEKVKDENASKAFLAWINATENFHLKPTKVSEKVKTKASDIVWKDYCPQDAAGMEMMGLHLKVQGLIQG